ncbi:hypothetical protein BX265_7078 [Streptomyces sp. TLI_235]|nr:hypothetical protein BX265_7078 [Streptomyces sp. TLI_235]
MTRVCAPAGSADLPAGTARPDGGWSLRVRVHGGRVDHRARRTAVGRGRRVWLEMACGWYWIEELDLERVLSGVVRGRCGQRAARDADPAGTRRWSAQARAERVAGVGQEGLFPAGSVG